MSWLWWKSPSDDLSPPKSSSPSTETQTQTRTQTQQTNSAPVSTSTSPPTNDLPTPVPDASTSTSATTIPSTTAFTTSPYQPLDPLTESSLPTTLPCTPLFDSAFFCSSLGGHLTSIYRTGSIADCRDNWSRFWFCMRTRAIWDPNEKREVIREYNRGNLRESYYGGRNWVLRDGEYRDRTGGMNPTVVTASSMTAARSAGGSLTTGSSKYAYATDDYDDDDVDNDSATAPEGSKEKKESWRSLFRARSRDAGGSAHDRTKSVGGVSRNGDSAAADSLAAGGGSGRYRSSEDVWELRTEPVARAFDLHPLRDLGEVLIDEQGNKYRVKDLEKQAGGHKG